MPGKRRSGSTHAGKKSKGTRRQKATSGAKERLATAEPTSLLAWLTSLHGNASQVAAAGAPTGACLVVDPHTGTNSCIITDEKTCKTLKGTYIGGPCGG